jgi:hypothetical protein
VLVGSNAKLLHRDTASGLRVAGVRNPGVRSYGDLDCPAARWGRTVYQEKHDEQISKTTFFGGQYLISYSGVADIAGNPEYWLVDRSADLCAPAYRHQWRERLVDGLRRELAKLHRRPEVSGFLYFTLRMPPIPQVEPYDLCSG